MNAHCIALPTKNCLIGSGSSEARLSTCLVSVHPFVDSASVTVEICVVIFAGAQLFANWVKHCASLPQSVCVKKSVVNNTPNTPNAPNAKMRMTKRYLWNGLSPEGVHDGRENAEETTGFDGWLTGTLATDPDEPCTC